MRAREFIIEGNDEEFHTGGSLGLPFPGTYEQEYNKFRRKGKYRITAMTNEEQNNSITLSDLYINDYPDDDELIWNYVGRGDFDIPFTIKTIRPVALDQILTNQYNVEHIDDLFDKMEPEQEDIVQDYKDDPKLSDRIIVLSSDRIVDGNHKALAAVLANKPIKYIDIAEQPIEEKWSDKYKRSIDCSNPKGFSQRAHCQGRKKKK